MTARHRLGVGAAVFTVYAVVAAATVQLSGRHVRPLFEGIAAPQAYRWVKPPPEFSATNNPPRPNRTDIDLTGVNGSSPTGVVSDDDQFLLNLPAGAIPKHGTDTKAVATITPLDPATLGPLPPDLRADGNAYRLELAYSPSNQPIDALVAPGNVILTVPHQAAALLFAADGRTWDRLAIGTSGDPTVVGGSFSRAGWYLGGVGPGTATGTTTKGRASRGSGNGGVLVAVVLVAALALGLGAVPFVRRRARARRRPAPRRRGSARRRRR